MKAGAFGYFHHIGIAVPDIAEPAASICALLDGRVIDSGGDDKLAVSWVWIKALGSPIIELLMPTDDAGPIARHIRERGPGLHHLSFRPRSLDDALSHVRKCSLPIIGENRDHDGHAEFFVHPECTGGALFHTFNKREDPI